MAEEHRQSLADKILWWLIGGMGALLMAGLLAWVSDNNKRLDGLRADLTRLQEITLQEERVLQLVRERQDDARRRLLRLEAVGEEHGRRLWWVEAATGVKGRHPAPLPQWGDDGP